MTYCFYLWVCFCLVIFQTTIMPYLSLFDRFYDLLCPFVIYLGLSRPIRESIPVVLFLGFVMDNLSGGPFGLYITTYFWLFISVNRAIKFLHIGNRVLLPLVIASGVLIENFIFLGTSAMFNPDLLFPKGAISTVAVQVLWAICTGPFFLMSINYTHKRWDKWLNELFARENRYNE